MSDVLSAISTAVIEGDIEAIAGLTDDALGDGHDAQQILNDGLMPGMDYVGTEFRAGNMFVPEVLRSAKAMQGSMNILRPMLAASNVKMAGTVLLGTVKGDLHDIGKNLVKMMLEGAGFEVVDLGTDVAPEAFVAAVREHQPQVIGMSALLTTTMVNMQATIDALTEAGLRDQIKVLIGGAPVTADFAQKIGADAFAPDAASAVDAARSYVLPA